MKARILHTDQGVFSHQGGSWLPPAAYTCHCSLVRRCPVLLVRLYTVSSCRNCARVMALTSPNAGCLQDADPELTFYRWTIGALSELVSQRRKPVPTRAQPRWAFDREVHCRRHSLPIRQQNGAVVCADLVSKASSCRTCGRQVDHLRTPAGETASLKPGPCAKTLDAII